MYGIEMFRKTQSIAKIVKVLLWANLGLAVVNLLSGVLASTLGGQGELSDPIILAISVGMLGALALLLATGISFLIWMNRAHKSAQGLGTVFMEHSSASAVWWWFVPIASLWKPKDVMREIHSVASPAVDEEGSRMITIWWAFWVASQLTSSCGDITGEDFNTTFVMLNMIPIVFTAVAAYYAVQVVDLVTSQQERAWASERTVEVFE
jgi:hypothetical protein